MRTCCLSFQARFASVEWSLLSTFVMMIGELEYTDLFFGNMDTENRTQEYYDQDANYEVHVCSPLVRNSFENWVSLLSSHAPFALFCPVLARCVLPDVSALYFA